MKSHIRALDIVLEVAVGCMFKHLVTFI